MNSKCKDAVGKKRKEKSPQQMRIGIEKQMEKERKERDRQFEKEKKAIEKQIEKERKAREKQLEMDRKEQEKVTLFDNSPNKHFIDNCRSRKNCSKFHQTCQRISP